MGKGAVPRNCGFARISHGQGLKKPQSLASAAAACLAQPLTLEWAGGRMLPVHIPTFQRARGRMVVSSEL